MKLRLSATERSALFAMGLVLPFFLVAVPARSAQSHAPAGPPPQTISPEPNQARPGDLSGASITTGIIEKKIEEVSGASDQEEAEKTRLIDLYRKALTSLEATASYKTTAATYSQALKTAPEQTKAILDQLQASAPQPEVEPLPRGSSVQEIEQRLAKVQADAAAVDAKLGEMDKEIETWSRRPAESRDQITEAKNELGDLDAEIDKPTPPKESPLLTEAHRWALQTRQEELRAQILMLDQDLLSYAARGALLKAKRDKSTRDLKGLHAQQSYLEEQLEQRRRAEAEKAQIDADAAQRKTAGKHPLLQQLADQNSSLTSELSELTAALGGINDKQAVVAAETKRITDEFRNARQRLEISGMTRVLGQVLGDSRNKLPDLRAYRREAKKREDTIVETTLRQIHYDEERKRLRDLSTFVNGLTAGMAKPVPADLRKGLLELAQQRQELLEKVTTTSDAYLKALGDLDYATTQLINTTESYDNYLSEHLLWVRSSPPVGLATFSGLPAAIAWLIGPGNWLQVIQVLFSEGKSAPLMWLLIVSALLLLWRSQAIRAAILASSEPLRRVATDRITYTIKAISLGILLAAPWPLLLAALGQQLSTSLDATAFTKAIGQGALSVAFGLFSLRAFSLLCIPGGVADRHFLWSSQTRQTIRRNFNWAVVVLIPISFVATAAYGHQQQIYANSLGRTALVVLTVAFALFVARLTHPKTGVLSRYMSANPRGWVNRFSSLWYPLVVATPLALAVLSLIGYVYTAGTLLRSLGSELWLILGLTVVHQLVVRWLILTRRRLALRAAIDRHASRIQEAQQGTAGKPSSVLQVEEPELDLASLDERTRALVNSLIFAAALLGLWAIYSDVLPALAVFKDISLWSYTAEVNGRERVIPVTVANVGGIMIIAVIATIAAKNLPAFLEILLLERISMPAGNRYTVKTLTAYAIVTIAVLMIFSTLGLSWSEVQWLVAALGVGIGFGLQEIVANFISGLIILFERPVRVGDIVTVGDTTGVVTNIQIRATTIRNWDKQELLVPNKELITGRLLNWSLSDQLNRLVIMVGVDYGADIPQALDLLRMAAEENKRVLQEPEPLITFEGFGDNSLNLVLRCYLESLEYRLSVTSELHQSINEKFRAAGISIAFPQRDVHLSTAEPLDVWVHQVTTKKDHKD